MKRGIDMKRIFAVFIGILSLFILVACKDDSNGAMTHAEYLQAEKSSTVTIEAYIQDKQSWWVSDGVGVASFYLQDKDGGYFAYNLPCTKDAYDNELTKGTKVRITGQKTDWAGEIEIDGLAAGAEATYEILKADPYIAEPKEINNDLGTANLEKSQNMLVSLKNLYVVAQADGESAFYYKWDNSGKVGDDLYVTFSDGTHSISACVESYLRDKDSEVYKTVEALKVGDKVNVEGFLYWYNGAQPHLIQVTKNGNIFDKASNTNTHAEFISAANGAPLVIEAFIQGKQSWWESDGVGVASFYLQDNVGGYFAYNLPCTKSDYDTKLTVGTKIRIKGNKTSWAGEQEIDGLAAGAEATYEILNEIPYIAKAMDVTKLLGTAELEKLQNMLGLVTNLTVVAKDDTHVIYYKFNNAGTRGDDIYFDVSDGTTVYTFTVESYLCDKDSDCYKAVEALKAGDKISVEGFLYWYNGVQPHVTKVTQL